MNLATSTSERIDSATLHECGLCPDDCPECEREIDELYQDYGNPVG